MDWSIDEVNYIVEDYFDMLRDELTHHHYNKTAHRNKLLPLLNGRKPAAVEKKHQNISAVLIQNHSPYIKGYKPLSGYQQLLKKQVLEYRELHKEELEVLFNFFANEEVNVDIPSFNFEHFLNTEPVISKLQEDQQLYRPVKINYLEKEQNNRSLGENGEKLVLEYEKWRLIHEGKENLVDKIEWISKEQGDGAGYDILSKNVNGTDRYIEVKTTKLSKETPIFLTATEFSFAQLKKDAFFLYRVFDFYSDPQFFFKNGNYENFSILEPQTFKAFFY